MTNIEFVIVAMVMFAVFWAGVYIGHFSGYYKGRRKGLHDGWILGQGGEISPGLSPLEAWEMPMVHPDGWVYRDGKIEDAK